MLLNSLTTVGQIGQMAIVCFLASLRLIASAHKFLAPSDFNKILRSYAIVPDQMVATLVLMIPVIELSLGVTLLIPSLSTFALFGVAALFGLYCVVMLRVLLAGLQLKDCGCGGSAQATELTFWQVIRNIILIAMALLLGVTNITNDTQSFYLGLSISHYVLVFATTCFSIVLYWLADTLAANNQSIRKLREHYG